MQRVNFKRVVAFVLALLLFIPLSSCGTSESDTTENDTNTTVSGSDTESESQSEKVTVEDENGTFLEKYADCGAAEKWIEENINSTDVPPVNFTVGDKNARELKWSKETGEPYEITDFPNTENPVKRTCRDIKYTCEEEQITVKITLTTYPNYPVAEFSAGITNLSSENSKEIKDLSAYGVSDCGSDIKVHYNYGSRNELEDFKACTASLKDGKAFSLKNKHGLPSEEYMPYMDLENSDGSGGTIVALNWQGDWKADFSISSGKLIISAGENGTDFVMLGNESFKSMGLVMLFYKNGDWQYGQNVWRRWVIEHNLMRNTGRRDVRQNVYICSDFGGYKKDIKNVERIASIGELADKFNCVYELDAGWYNCGGNWNNWPYTGNYRPDPTMFPKDTLAELSKKCAENGVGFCLWMEPERFYKSTPEHTALGDDNIIKLDSDEYLVNYGTKKTQDYITSLIDGVVKDYGLTVYRQDFNTINSAFWKAADAAEEEKYGVPRKGATQSHACEGYIDTWTRVSELNPGLIFDSCAQGGRRLDIETVRFSFAHTKSDKWADGISAQCQNLAIYSWLPFVGTGFVSTESIYDVRTRLTASIGVGKIDNDTVAALEEWASLQKYMYNDYYQLTGYDMGETKRVAMQFDDYENNEGMAIAYLRIGGSYNIRLKGLKTNKTYKVYDKDIPNEVYTMSGAELMEKGFKFDKEIGTPYAAVMFYEEAK